MPIFKLTAPDAGLVLHVRARCISCARDVAASDPGPEGPRPWRDPVQSSVELVRNPGYLGLDPDGRRAILKRETT